MKFEIKNRYNGSVLFECDVASWKIAVELAISKNADLSYANLCSDNLSSANLSSANLSYADLSYADLSSANLRSANLRSANLSSANLSSADLSYANLLHAELSSANLSYADLSYADLLHAELSSANLSYVDLMLFQYQQHPAYFTLDGALRIGCHLMPISEWLIGYKEIGKASRYSDEQILMYGNFIKSCAELFELKNKKPKGE